MLYNIINIDIDILHTHTGDTHTLAFGCPALYISGHI